LLAALRGGIKTVLIPKENEKDLADIPDNVTSELEIIAVTNADEVMEHALVTLPVPIEWPDEDDDDEIKVSESKDAESIVTH